MKINVKNLIAYSVSSDHIDKEGYLLKRGEVNKAYQRRWFTLKGNLLFYFEKKGDKEPVGVIVLEGCTTELVDSEEHYGFKLVFPGEGSRVYVLAAESQELLESWMKCISRASYDYLKLMVAELQKQLEEIEELDSHTGSGSHAVLSPVSVCTKPSSSFHHRENPFNKPEEECSFSDLWKCNESSQNASFLLSRMSFNMGGVTGFNSSLPPSVPFRRAPPPPVFHCPAASRSSRSFVHLHRAYGIQILNDKQLYDQGNLLRERNNRNQMHDCSDSEDQNLIDL